MEESHYGKVGRKTGRNLGENGERESVVKLRNPFNVLLIETTSYN